MPRRRISPLFAVFVAFVVLMASNAWLKGIFGYGEIATDIPFLLAGAIPPASISRKMLTPSPTRWCMTRRDNRAKPTGTRKLRR